MPSPEHRSSAIAAAADGRGRPEAAAALVTGASRGIGAAIAHELGAAGWRVAVNYRDHREGALRTVAAIQAGGGRAAAFGADVSRAAEAERLLAQAEDELGPVLCLVNNAGVRDDALALSLTDDQWECVLATNLTAAFRITRMALRGMVRARFGRVVSIASVVGPRANAGQANYAAAKAGVIAMSRTIAVEVARRGVTVNALAPGFIATDMTRGLDPDALGAVPARRPGRPEEVAACVRFLASDAAAYVTGSTLFVDGGLAA
jgi:3-oxoacyl-[acyl-carrier protein] reductase